MSTVASPLVPPSVVAYGTPTQIHPIQATDDNSGLFFTKEQKHAIMFSCLILVTWLMAMDFINPSLPYMPFILPELGFSPIENGVMYSAYAIALMLSSLCTAKYFSKFDQNKVFMTCCIGYIATSALSYVCFHFSYSVELVVAFSVIIAFICGTASPLALSLCMQGFTQNKGAASAIQSFIKMFFTGLVLLMFNFIPLRSINSLLLCYMILSGTISGLFALDKCLLQPPPAPI